MNWTLLEGDAIEQMQTLPEGSVHCCVTSPPYWGLRDYGTSVWEGGTPDCDHMQQDRGRSGQHGNGGIKSTLSGRPTDGVSPYHEEDRSRRPYSQTCARCGAARVDRQLGIEETPGKYVDRMVEVFEEVRRVLRDDGVLFLNLGDSYFGSTMTGGNKGMNASGGENGFKQKRQFRKPSNAQREAVYDTSYKAPEDCPVSDCLCGSLCDACRVAYQIGKSHNGSQRVPMPTPSPCESSHERTELQSVHLPTSGSSDPVGHNASATLDLSHSLDHASEISPDVPESTSAVSFPQSQDECLPISNPVAGCQLCGHSLPDCVPPCGCKKVAPSATRLVLPSTLHQMNNGDIASIVDASVAHKSGKVSDLPYQYYTTTFHHLKPKDLIGIPWRVAFALQEAGWYLRSGIIWHKPNPMPESVTDRCTKSHEYLFMFAKSERYYFDGPAIAESQSENERTRRLAEQDKGLRSKYAIRRDNMTGQAPQGKDGCCRSVESRIQLAVKGTRNKRSVWTIPTCGYAGAHFATFPPDLIKPCILAGCPEGGTVLEPFAGSGTTLLVANSLSRNAIGIELNPSYCAMARERLAQGHLDWTESE